MAFVGLAVDRDAPLAAGDPRRRVAPPTPELVVPLDR
jgi:hypothetical protein